MKKVEVDKIDGYYYYLKDENKEIYKINVEFYDIDFKVAVKDFIYINERYLEGNEMLSFGSLDNITGRKMQDANDPDILVISHNNTNYYLKRVYG